MLLGMAAAVTMADGLGLRAPANHILDGTKNRGWKLAFPVSYVGG